MAKIIAVDFDGTLCENAWPNIGAPKVDAINRLITEIQKGAKVILWTCRVGELLDDAVAWCGNHGIRFDAINDNLPEMKERWGNNPRKVYANEYWDDRNAMPDSPSCDKCLNIKPTQGKKQRVAEWCVCSCKNYRPKE